MQEERRPARACSPRAGWGSSESGGQGARLSWREERRGLAQPRALPRDSLAPRERGTGQGWAQRPAPSPGRMAAASRALRPAQWDAREQAGGAPWDAACLGAGGRSSERAPLARASCGLCGPSRPPRWRARGWRAVPPRALRAPPPLGLADSPDGGPALASALRRPRPWRPALVGRAAWFLSWSGRSPRPRCWLPAEPAAPLPRSSERLRLLRSPARAEQAARFP